MDSDMYDDSDEGASSHEEIWETNDEVADDAKKIIPVHPTEIDGMVRLHLSKITQRILGCEVGENVTTEYPWMFVNKDIVEDNLDLHTESSDFLPIQNEVFQYPDKTILIGLAPIKNTEDQFYICLTEQSRDTVIKQIELLRSDQETRVKNCVFRDIGGVQKSEDGSGDKDDESAVTAQRVCFQTEITVKDNFFETSVTLTNRDADDQRDGYVQLIPTRMTLNSITNKLVSQAVDTNPQICNSHCQTASLEPINSWFQYSYNYKPINTEAYNQEEARVMQQFLRTRERYLIDQVLINTLWDIHNDDSVSLVKNKMDIQIPAPVNYTEYQNYHNKAISQDQVINDLCWHPLRTGVAVVAYGSYSRHVYLPKIPREENIILIWSLSDSLSPKLTLEAPREVNTVSINPLDGNIIIGGCCNGQVMAWSIEGKPIDGVVHNEQESKCKIHLRKLMAWMKEPSSAIEPIVMSSIESSQTAGITKVIWLNRTDRIKKTGKFGVPDEEEQAVLGQFVSGSEDGSIVFWSISIEQNNKKTQSKKSDLPLLLNALSYVLTPIYKLNVKHTEQERNVIITTMNMLSPRTENDSKTPESSEIIMLGTSEGDVGAITWDGLDFVPEITTNSEVARWLWINNDTHDGPVTHSARSKYLHDVVVTIGGRVFAVWSETFRRPVLSKQSTMEYTAVSWGTSRPTVLILARNDGAIEIWDFLIKSHEAVFVQSISSTVVTGIYTHQLYLNPQCIAFCDLSGAMRIFLAPPSFALFEDSHVAWLRSFVDREIDRIEEFEKWQPILNQKYFENLAKQKNKQVSVTEDETLEKTPAEGMKNQVEELETKENKDTKPLQLAEQSKQTWKMKMLKKMQDTLLEKKGLKILDIDKRQAPVLNLRREEENKKKKVIKTLQNKEKIFKNTVNISFPETTRDDEDVSEKDVKDKGATATSADKEEMEKIIREYKEIEKETLETMKQWQPPGPIDWPQMIRDGERRRRSLDVDLKRVPKKRYKAPIVKPEVD